MPFTPVTGRRLLARSPEAGVALLAAGRAAVAELKASSLHITFLTEAEWREAGEAGYLLRTDQQFHWENKGYTGFDQFLGALSSSKRKNLRKERAAVHAEGIEFDWLTEATSPRRIGTASSISTWTPAGGKWGHPYLTRDFFSRIGESMADQVLLVMARRGGRHIAGALNFVGGGTVFGRNWGCTEYVPFLHFETCYYQAIEFAIQRGLAKVERRAGRAQAPARLHAHAHLQCAFHRPSRPAPRRRRLSGPRARSRGRAHRGSGRAWAVPEGSLAIQPVMARESGPPR